MGAPRNGHNIATSPCKPSSHLLSRTRLRVWPEARTTKAYRMRQYFLLSLILPLSFVGADDSDNLLWGAYRPNLYFGVRPQLPQSLMTGLLWFGTSNYQSFTSKPFFLRLNEQNDKYMCHKRHAMLVIKMTGLQAILGQNTMREKEERRLSKTHQIMPES